MQIWDFYYQSSGNSVVNENNEVIGTLEVTSVFNIPFGSTKQGEYLVVTLNNGKKVRCWRRKSSDNSYNIMPCSS